MPRRFTMSDLVVKCQRRADKENDDHIAAAEWKALISEQYGDVYSVVAGTGMQYFQHTSTIATTGASYYDEPADHLSTVALDRIVDSAGTRRSLQEIMAQERARFAGRSGSEARVFALVDDRIYLYPTPPSGQTYELLYIPQPPDLGSYADADVVDLVTPDGEAFLVWGVAVKALSKGEGDVRLALAERDAARGRLLEWAAERSINEPRRIIVDSGDWPSDPAEWRNR